MEVVVVDDELRIFDCRKRGECRVWMEFRGRNVDANVQNVVDEEKQISHWSKLCWEKRFGLQERVVIDFKSGVVDPVLRRAETVVGAKIGRAGNATNALRAEQVQLRVVDSEITSIENGMFKTKETDD